MLRFDTTRPPLREQDFVALVRAVVAARPGDESSWLEWKGHLELAKPEARGAVAKCVVAFANRDPQAAARFCDGRAYLVVGAEPGEAVGIPEADPADLTGWWQPFLGADGPRWVPHWVGVDGVTVLVVEVDTPRQGDPLHVIRKATDRVPDGAIYVRRAGKSEPATSADIRALMLRAGGARTLTGVSVRLAEPDAVIPVAFGPDAIEQCLDGVRDACLASLRAAQAPAPRPVLPPLDLTPDVEAMSQGVSVDKLDDGVSLGELEDLQAREASGDLDEAGRARLARGRSEFAVATQSLVRQLSNVGAFGRTVTPEKRTVEQYTAEVEGYLAMLRSALPNELAAAASNKLLLCSFELTNETEQNLEGVRLVVHLPDTASATRPDEDRPGLPEPPRSYGPRLKKSPLDFGAGLNFPGATSLSKLVSGPQADSGVDIDIEPGGSVTLRFDPEHLRPQETVRLDPVVLLLPDDGPVTAMWEAASTSVNGVLRGELAVPVSGPALSIQAALREESAQD